MRWPMRTLWPDETLERRPGDSRTSRWYPAGQAFKQTDPNGPFADGKVQWRVALQATSTRARRIISQVFQPQVASFVGDIIC